MAYANGKIPLSALGRTKTGHRLRADAADAYDRMETAFRRDMGYTLAITDAYRDLVSQYAVKAVKGFLAATPGTSNHGWGLALDLASGVNSATHPAHRWMDDNAHRFGWVNPAWAQTWKFEPWHWEYVPALDAAHPDALPARPAPPTSTVQEDDMPTANEIAGALLNTPHPEFQGRTLAQQLAQIINNDAANRTHLQSIIQSIPAATLAHVVPRAGQGRGETNLGAVVAYTDDHQITIMTKLAEMS